MTKAEKIKGLHKELKALLDSSEDEQELLTNLIQFVTTRDGKVLMQGIRIGRKQVKK